MLTFFVQNVFNALQWGSFYSMIALGYCLVYGVLRLINFAHGDIFMTSCYIAFFVVAFLASHFAGLSGVPLFIITLVVTMALTSLLGIGIERIAYRLLGASARSFPDILPKYVWNVGPVTITSLKVLVIVSAIVIFGLLQFIVQKTTLGMSMRAISYDKFAIPLMGIPVNTVITFTFGLGSALAAVAGILFGMSYPVMDPYMGMIIGWKAFIAAVVGGIGDIKGAFLGGFLLGFVEIFVTAFLPSSYKDLISFVILLVILTLKPTGFFGVAKSTKI